MRRSCRLTTKGPGSRSASQREIVTPLSGSRLHRASGSLPLTSSPRGQDMSKNSIQDPFSQSTGTLIKDTTHTHTHTHTHKRRLYASSVQNEVLRHRLTHKHPVEKNVTQHLRISTVISSRTTHTTRPPSHPPPPKSPLSPTLASSPSPFLYQESSGWCGVRFLWWAASDRSRQSACL